MGRYITYYLTKTWLFNLLRHLHNLLSTILYNCWDSIISCLLALAFGHVGGQAGRWRQPRLPSWRPEWADDMDSHREIQQTMPEIGHNRTWDTKIWQCEPSSEWIVVPAKAYHQNKSEMWTTLLQTAHVHPILFKQVMNITCHIVDRFNNIATNTTV